MNTEIRFGSLDVNQLKTLKPLAIDLDGLWSRVDKPRPQPLIAQIIFGEGGRPLYSIQSCAALEAGAEIWQQNTLPIEQPQNPSMAGLFLAICSLASKMTSKEWDILLLKENWYSRTSDSTHNFAFVARKYDSLKNGTPQINDPFVEYVHFAVQQSPNSPINQMQNNILQALRT